MGWQAEHQLDHRRCLRNGLLVSFAVHGLFLALLVISPSRTPPPFPDVIMVDLILAPMAAAPAQKAVPKPQAKPAPAPKPAAKPVPETAPQAPPKAAPEPPPPAPPPIAKKALVQPLPENAPTQIRKVEPKKRVDPRTRPPEKELSYEEAMAALGAKPKPGPESVDDAELFDSVMKVESGESSASPRKASGIVVSREMMAWATKTTRLIQNNWKGTSVYKGQGLMATIELNLSAQGDVLGTPRVVRSSGDPYFDDNAVRALMMVSPLPQPPHAGLIGFVFSPDGN